MAIARYYDPSKNPDGGAIPGVPLADIDEEAFEQLPPWLQASVDASPMYRKTRPPKAKEDRAASEPDITFTPAPEFERDVNEKEG